MVFLGVHAVAAFDVAAYVGITVLAIFLLFLFWIVFGPSKSYDEKVRFIEEKHNEIIERGLNGKARIISAKCTQNSEISQFYELKLEIESSSGDTKEISEDLLSADGRFVFENTQVHFLQENQVLPIMHHPDNVEWFVFKFQINALKEKYKSAD